jgi:cytidylate kinase
MGGHVSVVAISGKSGCGNTTVSELLAKRTGRRFVNYTLRAMAVEMGIGFEEILKLAAGDPSFDRRLDKRQVELALEGDSVMGSRLAIWLMKEADLKVYLYASDETRARRIQKREGNTFEEKLELTRARDARDRERYLSIYGIDNDEYRFADLIINAERMVPERIVATITAAMEAKEYGSAIRK